MINPIYSPAPERYDNGMKFRRCGQSGILLPEISLGLWHNFGDVNTFANSQDRKSTRLNSSHIEESRMPSSA